MPYIKTTRSVSTLYDEGYLIEGKMGLNVKRAVIFGHIREVDDHGKVMEMTRKIGEKCDPTDYVAEEVKRTEKVVNILEPTIDHMTGKLVNES